MGALGDGRFDGELEEDGLHLLDPEPETATAGEEEEAGRRIEEAVRVLLVGLGEDPGREGLRRTPQRVSRALREAMRGYKQNVKNIVQGALFPETGLENATGYAGGSGGLVVVRDINLFSTCESCLLPFSLMCQIGYVPSRKRVIGLSKLSKVADVFAKRLQDPQRLAVEVCSALQLSIKPAGVAIALQCRHIGHPEFFMQESPTICKSVFDTLGGTYTAVCASSGVFNNESSSLWDDFLALLKLKGVNMETSHRKCVPTQSWCPLRSLERASSNGHAIRNPLNGRASSRPEVTHSSIIRAVASIIELLGDDSSRRELADTPYCFVNWMMRFKNPNIEVKFSPSNCNGRQVVPSICKPCAHELNLPFCTQCEHHLLPFYGVVHISYYNGHDDKALDRSMLQSMISFYSSRLQVQERFTKQVAEAVYTLYNGGVMVVVEAIHICMISRGIEKIGSSTATIAELGYFSSDSAARADFLQIIAESCDR